MALPKIALKDLKDRAVFTRPTRSAFFGAATRQIPRHAYFGFLPHVFHCCSTGSPLRFSEVLFGKNLAFGAAASDGLRKSSGSLAMFAAIRRASSLLSSHRSVNKSE